MSWQSYVDDHHRHRARHAGCDLRRRRRALGRLRRLRRASPRASTDERWMLLLFVGTRDARSLPPRVPRSQVSPRRCRRSWPAWTTPPSSGGRRARRRREIHVHSVRRPPGGGQEGAFSSPCASALDKQTSFLPRRSSPPPDPRPCHRPRATLVKTLTRLSRVENPRPLPPPSRPRPPRPPTPTTQGNVRFVRVQGGHVHRRRHPRREHPGRKLQHLCG